MKRRAIFSILIVLLSGVLSTSCQTTKDRVIATTDVTVRDYKKKPDYTISHRFVVLADSRGKDLGTNHETMVQILKLIKTLNPQPEFAVIPGDLVGGTSNDQEFQSSLEYFKSTITQFYPIEFYYPGVGNHETYFNKHGEQIFAKVFSEFDANFDQNYGRTVYYFDKGDARFFMLNNDHPGEMQRISGRQLQWVQDNINQNSKHHFFFIHEPSFPTCYKEGKAMDTYREERNIFWDLVEEAQNPVVFCGHEHFYSRRHITESYSEAINENQYVFDKSVNQVTIGGFGGPLYATNCNKDGVDVPPITKYHFGLVDITPDRNIFYAISSEGEQLDYFEN